MTRNELAAAGFALETTAYLRLAHFVDLLLRENQRVNLTAVRKPADIWRFHICESLALLPLIDQAEPQMLMDLGSGGGLPGIPLACVRDRLQVVLLDATRKKLDACDRMATELGLKNLDLLWGRAETLAHDDDLRESFDVVTARGVAALPTLIEYAAGFVRVGGQCWFSKPAESAEKDVAKARRAAGECSMKHVETRSFSLPDNRGERAVIVYEKHAPLRAGLPRGQGLPKRKPL